MLSGFEGSTYHIFNQLSPLSLQHPHSLGHIHQPFTLDLLTQETSSTEDPTPAGAIPAEENKGRAGLTLRGVPLDMQALRMILSTGPASSQPPQGSLLP